jgi:hypothetical protein
LIAAVESGELAISTAATLSRLPRPDQTQALAQRHAPKSKPPAPSSCPVSFGLFPNQPGPEGDDIALLWIGATGLADAIQALQDRGFRYTG